MDPQSGATLSLFRIDLDNGARLTVSLLAPRDAKDTAVWVEHLRELADSLEASANPIVSEVAARSELLRQGVQIGKALDNQGDGEDSLALLRTCSDYIEAVMEYLRRQARREP